MVRKRLLVVDDDETLLEVLSAVLVKNGYEVRTASTTLDGIRLLDSEAFDLVVSDVSVSGAGGRDFIYIFTGRPRRPPVIVMSGIYEFGEFELRKLNIALFLAKPLSKQVLLDAVKAVLPEG